MCQINTLRTFRWRHLLVKPERTYAYTWYLYPWRGYGSQWLNNIWIIFRKINCFTWNTAPQFDFMKTNPYESYKRTRFFFNSNNKQNISPFGIPYWVFFDLSKLEIVHYYFQIKMDTVNSYMLRTPKHRRGKKASSCAVYRQSYKTQ
jgi:hypothetical protein